MRESPRPDQTPAAPSSRVRRAMRLALFAAAGVLLVIGLFFAGIQTGPGRTALCRLLERAVAAAPGLTARIDGLEGFLPFSVRVGTVALMDHAGPWLVVADARLDWSPWALFAGRVEIAEISARIVRVLRPPDLPPDEEPTPMVWPPRLPSLPPVVLERLAVERLILDAPISGERTETAIAGRMSERGGLVQALLRADRRDGPRAFARLLVTANPRDWTLAVELAAEEAPGGPLGLALDPSGADCRRGPLVVALAGEGPLADWTGRLTARLADRPLLETDVSLGVPLTPKARARLALTGFAAPLPGMLPPQAAALAERIDFSLAGGTVLGTDAVFAEPSWVIVGPARLDLSGQTDPDAGTMGLDAALHIPNLAPLTPLTGTISGAFSARLTATGDLNRPTARLTLDAKDVQTPQAGLASAALSFDVLPVAELGPVFPGLGVTGGGEVTGLNGPGGPLFPGHAVVLAVDAGLSTDMDVAVRSLSVTAGGLAVAAQGDMPRTRPMQAACRITLADLGELATGLGLPLSGAFRADAKVDGQPDGQGLGLELSGGLTGLAAASGEPAAALITHLLGPSPTFSAKARIKGQRITVPELGLSGKNLRLTAEARADLTERTMASTTTLNLPDLNALSAVAGRPLRGEAGLVATLSGRLDSPDAAADIRLSGLRIGDMSAASADIRLSASDLTGQLRGRLAATAVVSGERLGLEAEVAMPPGQVEVGGLTLSGPGAKVTGQARLALDTGLISGNLSGSSADLGRLGAMLGSPLSGSFALDARFAEQGGGQGVTASLTGKGLGLPGAFVSSLSLSAELADVLRSPRGKLSLAASGAKAPGATVSSLNVAASGRDGKGMDFSIQSVAALDAVGPVRCDMAGRVAPGPDGLNLDLTRLAAKVADMPVTLSQKAALVLAGDRLSVTGLRLGLGKALLAADGGYDAQKADLKVTVTDVSLLDLAAFGAPGMTGTARAEARVTGSGARPEASLRLTAQGIGMPGGQGGQKGKTPSLAVDVTAAVGQGGMQATLAASGLGKAPLSARLALPARFSLTPFAFETPPDGALSGNVTADVELADFAALLAQANTRATGRLTADMAASGTLSAPVVSGKAGLSGGTVENADTGMRLKDLHLAVEAAGRQIRLVELSARDYGKGTMRVSGQADLSPGEGFSLDGAAMFDALTVADMELAKAALSGEVTASGRGSALAVTGKFFVGPAQVNIPSRLPPEVTQVAVVEINNPATPTKADKRKAAAPDTASDISLDVTVGVGNGVYVRGMGLESEWQGEVSVRGTAAAPHVTGGVHTLQGGGVEFFGRRLELVKGQVSFSGGTPPDPELNVEASIATSDATCGVLVTGSASAPKITLTSDPPLPRDEILARILFGRSAGTITAFQGLQMAQAGAALMSGGGTSLDLLSRTRRLAGLDELDFVPGQGGLESTRLRAAKYLAKGVKVTVDQGAAADSGSVSVEVDITPNISLESKVGADSNQGVGVNWKWDY
ncbi:MAG: translocation/assembly module TamB domain-containing protein [Desulfovibrionaceae bacterium]|nr:translocation/assembly module TamB domain-containing protein [Desulfovibrionaceae bacterium]